MVFCKQVLTLSTVCVFLSLISTELRAQEGADVSVKADFEPVHWAYSSLFGTGWYDKKDSRSVFVLRVPPRQVLRTSSISDIGERKWGVEIKYPVTLGLHDVEDFGDLIENDNFGTISFAPGVEVEIPINKQWYLRPFAHVGWGKELDEGGSAWIYYAGIKSQYEFPSESKYKWYLLNSLYYAGYSPDKGRSDHLSVAEIGTEFLQPLDKANIGGRPIDLHWKLMYAFMGNDIHFNLPDGSFEPIKDQWEVSVQASFRDGPLKVWFINVHRLGIGYRFSSSGEFSAITLSMRSWFTN